MLGVKNTTRGNVVEIENKLSEIGLAAVGNYQPNLRHPCLLSSSGDNNRCLGQRRYAIVPIGDTGDGNLYFNNSAAAHSGQLIRLKSYMDTRKTKTRATILLVEDDQEIRGYMKRFLEDLGYDVAVASDEGDSLRLISGDHPKVKLILLNQRMLSDDALSAGRRIREHVNVANSTPVIVLPFEFHKELEGTDENMGGRDYKSYMTSEQQLEDLLAGLLS